MYTNKHFYDVVDTNGESVTTYIAETRQEAREIKNVIAQDKGIPSRQLRIIQYSANKVVR